MSASELTTADRRHKVEMDIMRRLHEAGRHAAAVEVLRPLIERARVSPHLKTAALAGASPSVPRSEITALGARADVDAAVELLVSTRTIVLHQGPSPGFTAATGLPVLSQGEALAFAEKLLADWPGGERDRIMAVFRAASETDDNEEDDDGA